ncbi:hypothetical protein K470DRAFT_258308, partial [Piedraia hortae CBS 480.64]
MSDPRCYGPRACWWFHLHFPHSRTDTWAHVLALSGDVTTKSVHFCGAYIESM